MVLWEGVLLGNTLVIDTLDLDTKHYFTHTLTNGLTVALLPAKSRAVYCGFAVRTGSRNDPPQLPGLAHFVEHMLFKGTRKRRSHHIIRRMEAVGGDLNAYTTKDETFFYASAPRRELVRSMELLNDLVRHATFPLHELVKERIVVADEINLYKDTPSDQIFDDWEEMIFRSTPLEHPILGNTESLARMTPEDLHAYTQHYFTPARMIFFCMGQVSESRFVELAERYLGEPFDHHTPAENGVGLTPPPDLHRVPPFRIELPSETHQAHTLMGGLAYDLHHPLRTETSILCNLLAGNGMNTRLNILLREARGWVYDVDASYVAISDLGWWQIYFGSDPAHAAPALEVTLRELERLRREPLTAGQLHAWIKQLKGQVTMSTEQSEGVFLSFGREILLKGRYETTSELYARLERVTPESLRSTAEHLFDPDNLHTLIYLGR